MNNVVEKIMQEKNGEKHSSGIVELARSFLEKNGSEFGLPPSDANEGVAVLYNLVFSDTENKKTASEVDRDELFNIVKSILEKFAELLEASPVYYDLEK